MKEKQQRQLTVCRSYTHTHYTNSDDISDCSVKSARSNATWQKDSVHAWGEVHSRVFGQWRFVDRKWIGGMNEWKRAKSQWDEAKWSVFPSNIFYWSLTPPPPQPKKNGSLSLSTSILLSQPQSYSRCSHKHNVCMSFSLVVQHWKNFFYKS